MPFDWGEYLDVARALQRGLPGCTDEARLRTAVGRAYYAAFGHALKYCQRRGYAPRYNGSDHPRVRDYLKSLTLMSVAAKLERLHEWRKDCDYRDPIRGSLAIMAAGAMTQAQDVINAL